MRSTIQPLRKPRASRSVFAICLCCCLAIFLAGALSRVRGQTQGAISVKEAARVKRLLENPKLAEGGPLKCHVQPERVFLDFSLRFQAGFVISCDLAQFEGRPQLLSMYLRITPESKQSITVVDRVQTPVIPESRRQGFEWKRLRSELEFSGAVAVGEGNYQLEMLLFDAQERAHRKVWQIRAQARGDERTLKPQLPPGAVSSLEMPAIELSRESKIRQITVLLNAAPIFPWSNKLRAWDRSFLLSSVATLIRNVHPSRVRLIAFNLEQQRELFRNEEFDGSDTEALTTSLKQLELGTISYRALQNGQGWATLLERLLRSESDSSANASDAIIFLGPNVRNMNRLDAESIPHRDLISKRLYYFEYFTFRGSDFPDVIHHLTEDCKGTVFKLHSPGDFAASIGKLQGQLKQRVEQSN